MLIETYGCTLNQADSDMIGSILEREGFAVEYGRYDSVKDYDYVIVNTCTVKKATEQKILHRLGGIGALGGRLVIAGCMASANSEIVTRAVPSASIVSTSNCSRILDVIRDISAAGRAEYTAYERADKLANPLYGINPIARIPVSEGCLSSCTFCETKRARGPLNSFSQELILKAIRTNVERGAKEIQLTSQDMGAYGADRGTDVAELLDAASEVEGDFMIRVGMLNPEHLHRYFDSLVEAYRSGKVYKFMHLPVQSGSNRVLGEMARGYSVEEYLGYVCELKKKIDGISIATDFIVGYPTETEEDFMESLELLGQARPARANISRFSQRPHAQAGLLKELDNAIVKRRTVKMYRQGRIIEQEELRMAIGSRETVLITEQGKGSMLGRDQSYREVAVSGPQRLGERIVVDIVGAHPACLIGVPVDYAVEGL